MHSVSFPPVAEKDARVLILGSLPGPVSLQMSEYYAKSQNAFWPIMGELIGAGPMIPYAERLERLKANGIALWDVCESGIRPGALDSSIKSSSVVPNDLVAFFSDHPKIALICFNGAKASDIYLRKILPRLPPDLQNIRKQVLPSTSPALAAMSPVEKLRRWRDALAVASSVVGSIATEV